MQFPALRLTCLWSFFTAVDFDVGKVQLFLQIYLAAVAKTQEANAL